MARFLLQLTRKSRRKNPLQAEILWCGCRGISNNGSKTSGRVSGGSSKMSCASGAFSTRLSGSCVSSFALLPWLGEDFFPAADAGQIKLHLRAPTATRIEETPRCAMSRALDPLAIPAQEMQA